MALEQAWFLVFLLPLAIVGVFLTGILQKKKHQKGTVLVSNTTRFVTNPIYRKAITNYKFGVLSIILLLVISIGLAGVIAAKPVNISKTSVTQYNRDIVLCLDVSGSMIEVDNQIVEKFEELVKGFKGERVGLVVWNSSPHMVFPLTDNYDYIEENLQKVGNYFDAVSGGLNLGIKPEDDLARYTMNSNGGSLIGDGLAACGLAFDKEESSEQRSKSIILATDNVINGTPLITFEEATTYVTKENITVYGIRPTTGYEVGDEAVQMKTVIENINKGKYYDLENTESTKEIVDKITEEEATAIKGAPIIVKTPSPQGWILGISALVAASLFLMWRFKV